MQVDFNKLRKNAMDAYIALVYELNADENSSQLCIRPELLKLRSCLIGICASHETGNDNFIDVLSQNYQNIDIPIFENKEDVR